MLADLRQVPGVASVIETPSFAKIYGKRIIVMGGGAQVGLVAMGAISKQIDTTSAANAFRWTPFPWSANRSWQRRAIRHSPARARILVLAGALMGATSRPPSRKFGSGLYVISLNMAGSVPDAVDLVVSDPVQAGVMAVMAVADTAKFDLMRQLKRRY